MKFVIERDEFHDDHCCGVMYAGPEKLGHTCEDLDRKLEDGGEKIYGQTAIPRGIYPLTITFSHRFQRDMPQLLDVPGFDGVRIHGGNTEADTLGCPLLGRIRTPSGVADCHGPNERLMYLLEMAEDAGEKSTIEIK